VTRRGISAEMTSGDMSEGDKSKPMDFGSDSAQAAIEAAKRRRVPVGGVPMPVMPRLDQVAAGGTTGVQKIPGAHRILTPDEQKRLAEQGQFQVGVGSAYAINQPAASRLPTSPEGEELPVDPKLAPRPPGSGLRPDTVRELTEVAAANSPDNEELKSIRKEIDKIDEIFETNEFGERVKSLLGNKERARLIEARCLPLSLEDLLLTGSVQQKVPIVPGRFEPTFRSPQGDENLAILRLMSSESGSEEYILDLMQIYRLTAGLHAINSKPLLNHLTTDNDFSEDLFKKKFNIVKKMAVPILADMVVNFNWFVRRVQKLTVVDDIKSF
jgi:hypothetical protein